jgi:hypothetical protein
MNALNKYVKHLFKMHLGIKKKKKKKKIAEKNALNI